MVKAKGLILHLVGFFEEKDLHLEFYPNLSWVLVLKVHVSRVYSLNRSVDFCLVSQDQCLQNDEDRCMGATHPPADI